MAALNTWIKRSLEMFVNNSKKVITLMTMMTIDDTYYNDDKGDNLDAEARYDAALGPFLPLSPASEYSRQST